MNRERFFKDQRLPFSDARSYSMLYLQTDWCLKVQQSLWQTDTFRPVDTVLLAVD